MTDRVAPSTVPPAAPAPATSAPPAGVRAVVGRAAGQPELGTHGGSRSLGAASSVLPELAEVPQRERPWWRHPAFLVSMITTVLALLGALAWWIVSIVTDDSVRVDGLSLTIERGNAHLDWGGPDAAYALYAVDADGSATDLTQLVRGTEAWVPSATGLYDDATCFVVRPASVDAEVTLDAASLEGQRGGGVCVADAATP
ncbi:hypothetical protein [Agromyces aerolatus]|uniref:hypothetical protein n=1 Tax=Agromyces sp. LY-1074 TaxID=3074080 RepID=UPI002865B5EE|nr:MULTISPECIES: hypothetical protein [unclassified Agromyces]MDR5698429.1 hypothetical protein [Agromyces sp. LY-1074]MDR5704723.1 hypothetical protein [Agromyces sp. LY-1358]